MSETLIDGARYFIFFKDDNSSYNVVLFLKNKIDTIEAFKNFTKIVKNKRGYTMKTLYIIF